MLGEEGPSLPRNLYPSELFTLTWQSFNTLHLGDTKVSAGLGGPEVVLLTVTALCVWPSAALGPNTLPGAVPVQSGLEPEAVWFRMQVIRLLERGRLRPVEPERRGQGCVCRGPSVR